MNRKELQQSIKGVFLKPKKSYYFGRVKFGTPYFFPRNYNGSVLVVRKLRLRSQTDFEELIKNKPWLRNKENSKFVNLPLVRRCKYWILKIFDEYFYVSIGWPVCVKTIDLGWKDKFRSPRYEWSPQFHVFFFGLQFCMFWNSPLGNNDDYYEQILWYLYYSDRDIKIAERSWPWTSKGKTTWNKKYLV